MWTNTDKRRLLSLFKLSNEHEMQNLKKGFQQTFFQIRIVLNVLEAAYIKNCELSYFNGFVF